MKFELEIEDKDIEGFTNDAVIQLENEIKKYSNSIIKEAILFEEGIRENEATKEITANYVQIVSKTNKVTSLKKQTRGILLMKIVSPISLTVVGFFFEYPFSSFIQFIIFLLLIIVGTSTTVMVNVKENK